MGLDVRRIHFFIINTKLTNISTTLFHSLLIHQRKFVQFANSGIYNYTRAPTFQQIILCHCEITRINYLHTQQNFPNLSKTFLFSIFPHFYTQDPNRISILNPYSTLLILTPSIFRNFTFFCSRKLSSDPHFSLSVPHFLRGVLYSAIKTIRLYAP